MALTKLPEPPRHAIVDSKGVLTPDGRRWFDTLYTKMGKAGGIPAESLASKAVLNASNDAKVDWQDVDANGGLVRVAGPGGGPWHRFEGTETTFRTLGPFAAVSFQQPYGKIYYVAYDPNTTQYICTIDFRETLRDGLYWVGSTRANSALAGAGATSGGGGSAQGGVGGNADDPTIGFKSGLGVLG